MATPEEFYDALASEYHLLFADWWWAAQWHGRLIAGILAERGITRGRLLDCTCGIGTQALPLATLGYDVTATDVSKAAVARARVEAAARGIDVAFKVCDVRDLRDHVDGTFDVVITCDNALPHLLTDEHLQRALGSIRACLRPRGLLLISLRDYDALRLTRPGGVSLSVHGEAGSRHGSGQSWRWSADAEYVDIELFTFTEDAAGSWRARSATTRYRALPRANLDERLISAGFHDVQWLMPAASGYYQPIVLAEA
ncbi:class I SAM-dependent methyltransferase [Arthrobacter sp. RT-1]|uniref:class I SAM-dependent methyltransferase n=1 Tax=Arthrobacter sp. RT-1 TaxID=2292263 RepID=UPI000E1EE8BC|nr:class I SAM-dependent methyltransferase [Arthrobacter sp. RT-1]RDV11000.1 class I SAM-dependent methyltransferase [Arthrobacter sp. RT-1]